MYALSEKLLTTEYQKEEDIPQEITLSVTSPFMRLQRSVVEVIPLYNTPIAFFEMSTFCNLLWNYPG